MTRWEEQAECKGETALFFPTGAPTKKAIQLCERCPVIEQCAALALALQAQGDLFGYWGGMTRAQRIAITGHHFGAWWDNDN